MRYIRGLFVCLFGVLLLLLCLSNQEVVRFKTLEKKALTDHPDSTNTHFLKESDDIINLLDKGK